MHNRQLADAFHHQSELCLKWDAPLTAAILEAFAEGIVSRGPVAQLLADYDQDPFQSAAPMRLAGALHWLVRENRAIGLAEIYDFKKPIPHKALLTAQIEKIVSANREVFEEFLSRAPQTNEVMRAAALLSGFCEAARVTGLPMDIYEVGASGGLLLTFDQYRYDYGTFTWGRGEIPIKSNWSGEIPKWPEAICVGTRRGCDTNPIDLRDKARRNIAAAYIWPEEALRRKSFFSAIDKLVELDISVEKADAVEWVAQILAERRKGYVTVIYHSIFANYLSGEKRLAFEKTIENEGRKASRDRPLAWLRFEPENADFAAGFHVDLTMWPDGRRRRIATAHPHGKWVEYHG